jgi:hypothetical protein
MMMMMMMMMINNIHVYNKYYVNDIFNDFNILESTLIHFDFRASRESHLELQ